MSLDFSLGATVDLGEKDGPRFIEVVSFNITHNMGDMAKAVSQEFYEALWRSSGKKAEDIIPVLQIGLMKLKSNKNKYREFNPANGWGDYDSFFSFVLDVLSRCLEMPKAEVYCCV